MGPCVQRAGSSGMDGHGNGSEDEHKDGHDESTKAGELDLLGLDLLP